MTASGSVRAEVRYLNDEWKERQDRPFIYDRDTRRRNTTRHEVEIIDARGLTATGAVNVEANGLTFARHETSVRDFHDAEAVRASYETEIAPMLQAATGAREVFVQSHQVRTEDPETFLGAYSRYIHCDYPLHPIQDRERNLLRQHGSALANEVAGLDFAWFNILGAHRTAGHPEPANDARRRLHHRGRLPRIPLHRQRHRRLRRHPHAKPPPPLLLLLRNASRRSRHLQAVRLPPEPAPTQPSMTPPSARTTPAAAASSSTL